MKILIVTHYFIPHIGGIEMVVLNQAKELVKMGHIVTIITSQGKNEKKREKHDGITIVRVPAIHILEEKFEIPFPLFSSLLIPVMNKYVKQSDIIHAHGALYLGSVVAGLFSKVYKKQFFVTEHVGFVSYNSMVINAIEQLTFLTLGAISLSFSNRIFVLNKNVEKYLRRFTKKPFTQISNGVDTKLFSPVTKSKKNTLRKKYHLPLTKPVILFVGRFVSKKGLTMILEANHPLFTFVFAGRGIFRSGQKQKNMHVFYNVDQRELAELYQASDIFLLPSQGEGLPLSILEAMACGLPIITSQENKRLPVLHSTFTRYVSSSRDIKKLLSLFMNKPALFIKMGRYARQTALEKLSWEKTTSELMNFYTNKHII